MIQYPKKGKSMEKDIYKNFENGSLTQVDNIRLILDNARVMATKEYVRCDITDINKKIDKIEQNLKDNLAKLENRYKKIKYEVSANI